MFFKETTDFLLTRVKTKTRRSINGGNKKHCYLQLQDFMLLETRLENVHSAQRVDPTPTERIQFVQLHQTPSQPAFSSVPVVFSFHSSTFCLCFFHNKQAMRSKSIKGRIDGSQQWGVQGTIKPKKIINLSAGYFRSIR